MPDSLPLVFPANLYTPPDYSTGQALRLLGLREFVYEGYALIDTTTGNAIALRNERDLPCTIPCPTDTVALSANDPAYVTHVSFYIPKVGDTQYNGKPVVAGVTAGATDVLKLASAANIDLSVGTTVGAVSGAATAGAVPTGADNLSLLAPLPGITVTAATELRLFSATAANSTGTAGGNIRTTAVQKNILVPVRVCYYRKLRAPNLSAVGLSPAMRETLDKL